MSPASSDMDEAPRNFETVLEQEREAIAKRRQILLENCKTESGQSDTASSQDQAPYSALCFSGGGIRSAAFALGVSQGLARKKLLDQFDYLSTVSGGGYWGGTLTAWAQRHGYANVLNGLTNATTQAGKPLKYIRRYSNYLTPRTGLFSSDTLTALALVIRNLFLNWLILVPVFLIGISAIKLLAFYTWLMPYQYAPEIALIALIFLGMGLVDSLRQRPGWNPARGDRVHFLKREALPIFLAAVLSCISAKIIIDRYHIASPVKHSPTQITYLGLSSVTQPSNVATTANSQSSGATMNNEGSADQEGKCPIQIKKAERLQCVSDHLVAGFFPLNLGAQAAFSALSIFGIAWLIAYYFIKGGNDESGAENTAAKDLNNQNIRNAGLKYLAGSFAAFLLAGFLSGAVYAIFIGLTGRVEIDWRNSALLALGLPMLTTALLTGELLYVGLTSYAPWGEGEREWLARAAGMHGIYALFWFISFALVLFAAPVFGWGEKTIGYLASTVTISGFASVVLSRYAGGSSKPGDNAKDWTSYLVRAALALTIPIFFGFSTILFSVAIDYWIFETPLIARIVISSDGSYVYLLWLFVSVLIAVASGASFWININRFSLHGLYRNRLTRTFLGASNFSRRPDSFTGFDDADNLKLSNCWPAKPMAKNEDLPPHFHIINMALNVVRVRDLAWQERKALSFTASPLHTGSASLGQAGSYRRSEVYGDGISLGTAMTISGAAVSPNMGYHSSSALSILLTLFNVRLGAWLGNPSEAGNKTYNLSGPYFAARPLINEAMGLTTDNESYIYLSDGGHFENLALYEMVRRRCRNIIVCDAGCDPDHSFEDLGNAVRKISIDLDIKINFENLNLKKRGLAEANTRYFAIARIHYPEGLSGRIIYVKPGFHGSEPVSVVSYALANAKFPHETTADQWFGESQFEAYRALGEYIISSIPVEAGTVDDFFNGVDNAGQKSAA